MPPINLLVKPASSLCNMRCKYCFYNDVAKNREVKSYDIMSDRVLESLVQKTLSYADGAANYGFQGGEPTLVGLDFYEKLLFLQKKHNHKNISITNSIQTNGYLISEEFASFFAANNFLVGLSLDGPKEAHDALRVDRRGSGTFSKVMRAADLLKKHNARFNILCVVNNFNARHPKRMYEFYKKNGLKYLQFIPLINDFENKPDDYTLNPERYAFFLKILFDNYYNDFLSGDYVSVRMFDNYIRMIMGFAPENCGMSGICSFNLVIESDGGIYPCDFYALDNYRLGNIGENDLKDLLKNKTAINFVEESAYISEGCKACKWFGICRGGCKRYREPFSNGKPSQNIYCESYKEFFEYAFDRMLIMAKKSG